MKEYCETCEGKGFDVEMVNVGDDMCAGIIECLDCEGKGYTENTELERLAEIGRATEKAFHNKTFYTKENGKLKTGIIIVTVTDLLDWVKED